MKILVAVISDKNSDNLSNGTMKWAGRAGFNTRLFLPNKRQVKKYLTAIDNLNYDHYLDLPYTVIETGDPMKYAKKEGYDLLVTLPDNIEFWGKSKNADKTVIDYAVSIGRARVWFAFHPKTTIKQLSHNAYMERVK